MRLKIYLTIALAVLCFAEANAQSATYEDNDRAMLTSTKDSLQTLYSSKKELITEFKQQSLIALSYYPELRNIAINFQYGDIRTTMCVQPRVSSALTSHRKYIVFIDTNAHGNGILLRDVPFNGQIGIIGHELAHIVNYEKRSGASLVGLGIAYALFHNHPRYERSIDRLAIKRGLGHQLLCWADYALNKSSASSRYKSFKRRNYLRPEEIEKQLAKSSIYGVNN